MCAVMKNLYLVHTIHFEKPPDLDFHEKKYVCISLMMHAKEHVKIISLN